MDHCCPSEGKNKKKKFDWIFWGSLFFVAIGFFGYFANSGHHTFHHYAHSVFDLLSKMWIGIVFGVLFVGILGKIPQAFIVSILGKPYSTSGIFRAALAGLFLDMCSHGILMVGMKFYKKGASLGQTMAFLISSPWNSLSLTIILVTLIGLKWTLVFLILSMVVAIISGWIFDRLVLANVLPKNPHEMDMPKDFYFLSEAKKGIQATSFDLSFFKSILWEGITDSKMIIKWLLFGVVVASLIRTFMSEEMFASLLGPSLIGMTATLIFATVIEVCSEGSAPIAADIVTRAHAPGNGFLFLMAGASTDYTEILVLRETTNSWKTALFLPLITVPQVFALAYLINHYASL